MADNRLLTLGGVQLLQPETAAAQLRAGKPLALLVYLALHPAGLSRDQAADLLWRRAGREQARHSLRQALSVVRKALGAEAFASETPLQLRPGLVESDVQDLERALAAGDIDAAVALWRGPFLAGFVVADSPEWDEWTETFGQALTRRFGAQLRTHAARAVQARDYSRASTLYRAATGVEPLAVAGWAGLVQVLLDGGQRAEAEAALAAARTALAGIEAPDLGRLEARAAALRPAATALPAPPGLRLEFGGREAELAQLLRLWARARGGEPCAASITGPPGIGKSRLAEEVAAAAAADGGVVVQVKASQGEESLEYAVATALLRRLLNLRGAAGITVASDRVLRSLLPSIDGRRDERLALPPAVALGDALSDLVAAVAEEAPLLVIIDDMHWADPASRTLFRYAFRQLPRAPVLSVSTLREEELSEALRVEIRRTLDENHVATIRLEPLPRDAVRDILVRTLDVEPDDTPMLRKLIGATAGNPLFLAEVLKNLQETGAIAQQPEGWRVVAGQFPAEVRLPASVREVIRSRLDRLSADARALAAELAHVPAQASPQLLRRRARLREGAATRALAILVERNIVRWADDTRIDFTHDQLREIARAELPLRRHRREPRSLASWGVAAAGVLVLVAALIAVAWWAIPAGTPRHGGGVLYIGVADSLLVATPPARQGVAWKVARPDFWFPRSSAKFGPYTTPEGEARWFGWIAPVNEAPYVVRFLPDGRVVPLVRRDSLDAGLTTAAPDGSEIVYGTDRAGTAAYDIGLFVAAHDGSRPRLIFQGRDKIIVPKWSPDGHAIAAILVGRTDTVAVFSPRGARLASVPFRQASSVGWCGDSRALVAIVRDSGDWRLVRIDTRSHAVEEFPGPPALGGAVACSPDGRVAVYRVVWRGEARLVAHDVETASFDMIPAPANTTSELRWVDAVPEPVVASLRITTAPRLLRWGGSAPAEAAALRTDGKPWQGPLEWTSSDPAVLSVSAAGRVTGNRPGRAWLRVTAAGWRADSALVEVTGTAAAGVLLQERFRELSEATWYVVGAPSPTPIVRDGEPVLSLNGDGSHVDGIISRQEFALPRGGTLEAEFHLALTSRTDRQRIGLCIAEEEPPPDSTWDNVAKWQGRQSACAVFPEGELVKFRADELAYGVNGTANSARVAGLPPDGWFHLALQVQPDGEVTVLLNHRLVATDAMRLRMAPGSRWRVHINGAAVETEALVRNVVLWDGMRFEARPR